MIPQIRSVAINLLVILVGVPIATAYLQFIAGTLHNWTQFAHSIWPDGVFHSFWVAIGWLFLKSPFASKLTELVFTKEQTATIGGVTNSSGSTQTIKITEPVVITEGTPNAPIKP